MKIRGFTPVFDVLVEKYDTNTALVYGKIWRVCDWSPMNICSMSNETLGEQLGLSEKTIRRKKETLSADGLIKKVGRTGATDSITVVHTVVMSMDILSDTSDNLSPTMDTVSDEDIDSKNKDTLAPKREQDLVDGLLAYGEPYATGRGVSTVAFPEQVQPYNVAWCDASGFEPTLSERKGWIKTYVQWIDLGVKPEDVKRMYQYARDNDWGIARPGSITSAYRMMGTTKTPQQSMAEERQRLEELHG